MSRADIFEAVTNNRREDVRSLLEQRPGRVDAKGVDGGRPLHFCRDPEIAQLLIEAGADVDVRDDDHDSTAAQWRIGDAPEVVRLLLSRGATADLFLAVGLDDLELARQLVEQNPECTSYRIGNNLGPFPGIGHRGRGGTILQWTLGFNRSPHEIALERGHQAMFDFLIERTPPRQQLLVACMSCDRERAERLLVEHVDLVGALDSEDQQLLAKACWETNKDIEVVRLMLDLGFPVDVPERNHGYSALHNAAWCGDPDLVALLLDRGHPVDLRDPEHNSTAIGFALHSCLEAKRHPNGDFPGVIERLLQAGVPLDEPQRFVPNEGIAEVIRRHLGE